MKLKRKRSKPYIVEYLGDRIVNFEEYKGLLVLFPNNKNIAKMLVYEEPVEAFFSFDKKWRWVAEIPVEYLYEEGKKIQDTYDNLKLYEIKLEMKGLIRKQPFFVSTHQLDKPNALALLIEKNEFLISSIRKVKPDDLFVKLDFNPDTNKISWVVTLTKGPIEDYLKTRSKINQIFDIFTQISKQLLQFTKNYQKSAS